MSTTKRLVKASPDQVFDILANGWSYSQWVVGASRVRDVSADWPAEGAEIHHSVGAWPLLIDDTTTATRSERPARLDLTVRAWPSGEGKVELRLEGRADGTLVTMVEDASKGPALLIPKQVRDVLLDRRNREALRRLAILAERAQSAD